MPIIKNLTHVSPCSCSVSLPDNILTTGKSWVYSPPQSISASLEMAGGHCQAEQYKSISLLSFTLPSVTQAAPLHSSPSYCSIKLKQDVWMGIYSRKYAGLD